MKGPFALDLRAIVSQYQWRPLMNLCFIEICFAKGHLSRSHARDERDFGNFTENNLRKKDLWNTFGLDCKCARHKHQGQTSAEWKTPWNWAFAAAKRLVKNGVKFVVKSSRQFRASFPDERGAAKFHQIFHGIFHGDFHARCQDTISRQHFCKPCRDDKHYEHLSSHLAALGGYVSVAKAKFLSPPKGHRSCTGGVVAHKGRCSSAMLRWRGTRTLIPLKKGYSRCSVCYKVIASVKVPSATKILLWTGKSCFSNRALVKTIFEAPKCL